MNKCAAYIRVSTEEQTADNQLPAIKALCQARGWDLAFVYSENASAWKAGRQSELRKCIRDAQHHHFETIIVWSLDRLSREGPLKILTLTHHLKEKHIRLISVQEPWTESPDDFTDVLFSITSWIANWESKRRSLRTRAGIAEKQQHGGGRRGKDQKKRVRRWLKRPQVPETIDAIVDVKN
jgi:DNA invertase Pin-like site-specific DNA recombinase